MLSRPLPDLEARLKEVVWSRGAPHYASRAVIFYFENDDTDSDRDAITLRNCLEDVFDIKTRIVPIEKSETWAAMKVQSIILDECTAIRSPYRQLRSLVIIAYIGHGVLDYGSQLKFISADGKQNIRWKCIRDVFFNDNDAAEGFDALAILDCCYAGATRSMIDRVADVLSACGPRATARSRAAGYISFTQRLATAARQLRDVQPFVTVDDLLQRIQENKTRDAPNAQLAHLGQSAQPIALPFKKRSSASQPPNPRTTSPTTAPTFSNVLVKLSVAASPEETLGKLTNIIRTLPSEFNVTIEQVYESTSTLILLSMSWSTFSRLSTRIDLTLIGPIMGPALLSPDYSTRATDMCEDAHLAEKAVQTLDLSHPI